MEYETKKCCSCGIEFPKTIEFFHKKISKQKLADGSIATYEGFRSQCKKCKREQEEAHRVQRRCEEMGCDVSEYRENWKKQYSQTRTINPELSFLTRRQRITVRNKIKKGYVFTTHEQYKLDCSKSYSKARRKYDYGDCDFVLQKDKNRIGIKNLTDGYIALTMKSHVDEIPKEIIEQKRLILTLKRELKLTNYGNQKRS